MRKLTYVVMLLTSMPLLTGCPVALVGAGVGMVKAGNAKKSEAATRRQEAYSQYVVDMETLNLEREKSGLAPKPIPTFEEWNQTTATK